MTRVNGRRPQPAVRRPPAFAPSPYVEGNLAEMAAAVGMTEADALAGLDELEAHHRLVRVATEDDPGTVRAFLVWPEQYERMRAAADFLATPAGKELELWHAAWRNDPDLNDDDRQALDEIAAAVVHGGGTGRIGDDIFTIGDGLLGADHE